MIPDENIGGPGTDLMAAINKLGVPKTVKGKVQRAVFRLIVGGIGLEYFEKIRENLDTIEGRSRVNIMLAEEVARQAIADPEMMERAKARFLGEMATRQENVEAVARIAQQKSESDPDADIKVGKDQPEPSQDWMNSFIRAAEDASSDELRQRLASLLSEEAKRPGSFSRSTVRLIAELDKDTLQQFQTVLPHVVDGVIVTETEWSTGAAFARGLLLRDVGLISGDSLTTQTIHFNADGIGLYLGKGFGLVMKGPAGVTKQLSVWVLTRTGQEVASLLPACDEREALRRVADKLDKTDLDVVYLGQKLPTAPGQVGVRHDEILWQKS